MQSRKKPVLTVIQGEGQRPSPPWLDLPPTVVGRSAFTRNEAVVYRIAQADARKALQAGRRQPLLDLWSVVLGEIPPVNNALTKWGKISLTSISDSHACFRGIKRPVGSDDRGYDFYGFVSKPVTFFVYEPSLACVVKPANVPNDLVHVTYVRLDYPSGRPSTTVELPPDKAMGIITHWEFVEVEPGTNLPIDYAERYRTRMW